MIPDWETNTVYFSELFASKYIKEFRAIDKILSGNNVVVKNLASTKDIWCRDYMPVQVSTEEFIQFRYDPSYLNEHKYKNLKSDPKIVCLKNGVEPRFSSINLDGGNVIKCAEKVIVTDKVFDENPNIEPFQLLSELEEILNASVIIVPHHYDDYTGHADGMIRFINGDTVLVNDLSKESPSFRYRLTKVLKENKLNCAEMPMVLTKTAVGIYINYLQVKGLILIPSFGLKEDEIVLDFIGKCFPESKILPVYATEIAKQDGVLNCVSWNIYE